MTYKPSEKISSLIKILHLIDIGKRVTNSLLAENLGVTDRTICRYLKDLQGSGYPIYFDRHKMSYCFADGFKLNQSRVQKDLLNILEIKNRMMSTTPVGLASFDETGQCIDCNESIAAIVGTSREQVMAQNYTKLESWKLAGMHKAANEVMRSGIDNSGDYCIRSSFGRELWIFAAFSRFDLNGKYFLMLVAQEITQRKQLEIKTLATADDWSRTFDAVSDMIALIDKNFRITRANRAMADALGMAPAECIGLVCHEVLHSAQNCQLVCPHLSAMSTLETCSAEYFEPRFDKFLHVTASPLFDAAGTLQATVHIMRDISRDRQRDEELKENEAKYRQLFEKAERMNQLLGVLNGVNQTIIHVQSKDELFPEICRILVESGPFSMAWIGLVETDSRAVNPVAQYGDTTGYLNCIRITDLDEATGLSPTARCITEDRSFICNDFFNDPETIHWREAAEQAGIRASAAFPFTVGGKVVGALTLYATDKNFFGTHEIALLEQTANNIAFVLTRFNIEHERRVAETALVEARMAAEQANHFKSEFLANMSHEIRTPMTSIIGMGELLELTELSDEQKEYVEAISLSGNTLLSLVNDILDLSIIEADKVEIVQDVFNARDCIDTISRAQKSLFLKKHLSCSINVSPDLPENLIGDQLRIKQILLNLLGNSIKFTNSGGITISASIVESPASGSLLEIAVQDTGIGISEEVKEHIFEPFIQANGTITHSYGGSGLGLSISKRLAELMGGSITVESQEGVGSIFRLQLPLTIALPGIGAETRIAVSPLQRDRKPLKILLAEDNPVNILYFKTVLTKMGHFVTHTGNGREAVQNMGSADFDLVLMDIQMPVMNGEEALRLLREQEKQSGEHLPVIAVTAHALKGEKEKYLEMGFDGYLAKPVEAETLSEELQRMVRQFKL